MGARTWRRQDAAEPGPAAATAPSQQQPNPPSQLQPQHQPVNSMAAGHAKPQHHAPGPHHQPRPHHSSVLGKRPAPDSNPDVPAAHPANPAHNAGRPAPHHARPHHPRSGPHPAAVHHAQGPAAPAAGTSASHQATQQQAGPGSSSTHQAPPFKKPRPAGHPSKAPPGQAPNHKPAAKLAKPVDLKAELRSKEEAMAELRKQLEEKEAEVARQKALLAEKEAAREAARQAREAERVAAQQRQEEAQRRKAVLTRGFKSVAATLGQNGQAGSNAGGDKQGKPGEGQPKLSAAVGVADEWEVARVLAASNDYDCLKLHVGASQEQVKRSYKQMTLLLHPDKCKLQGAAEAFQRVKKAHDNLTLAAS